MITVNLLPSEFRVQEKREVNISFAPYLILGFIVFCILTAYFFYDYTKVKSQFKTVDKEWKSVQPQSAKLKLLEAEVAASLAPESDFLNQSVTSERPLTWFLSWASEYLPESAWLVEIRFERKGKGARFFLKGLAIPSQSKSSIQEIEVYLNHLKEKLPDAILTLTTTRQMEENLELTQFSANFEWGMEEPVKPKPQSKNKRKPPPKKK